MLGEPLELGTPSVVGVRMTGALREGVTATDLVLTLTELLRAHGVVGRFVEFCGDGLSALSLADRATLSNMSPSTAPPRRSSRSTTRCSATCARPAGRRSFHSWTPSARSRGCSVATAIRRPRSARWSSSTSTVSSPASQGRGGRRIACRWPTSPPASAPRTPSGTSQRQARARRQRRDRSDHVVHEHLQPLGDGGRGPARAQRRRSAACGPPRTSRRASPQAPASSPTTSPPRACRSRSTHWDSSSSATAARPASATRVRSPTRSREAVRDDELAVCAVLSGNRNFEGRIHPLVQRQLPRLSPARRRLRAGGLDRRRSRARPARHRQRGARTSSCATSGRPAARCATPSRRASPPELFERQYAAIWDGDERWQALPAPEGGALAWDAALDVRARAVVLPGAAAPSRSRSRTSWTLAAS